MGTQTSIYTGEFIIDSQGHFPIIPDRPILDYTEFVIKGNLNE